MNRKQRRARAKKGHTDFYNKYVKHLPCVPLDVPMERGKVYHHIVHHDDWCAFYSGEACNCNPIITRHVEPRRS